MFKAILVSLSQDVVSFFEAYFFYSSQKLWRHYFLLLARLRKIFSQSTFSFLGILLIGVSFGLYFFVWSFWVTLPFVLSVLLYNGTLF